MGKTPMPASKEEKVPIKGLKEICLLSRKNFLSPGTNKGEPDCRAENWIILIGGLIIGALAIYQLLH